MLDINTLRSLPLKAQQMFPVVSHLRPGQAIGLLAPVTVTPRTPVLKRLLGERQRCLGSAIPQP